MKAEMKLLYKVLKINDKDVIKVGENLYYIDQFTLKFISGNDKNNYHDQFLTILFDREETFKKICTVACNKKCNECPIRILDCSNQSKEQPIGLNLYAILSILTTVYKENDDTWTLFKNKIDEYFKKKADEYFKKKEDTNNE